MTGDVEHGATYLFGGCDVPREDRLQHGKDWRGDGVEDW